ncbi:MAG TPA: hypothetical protein VFA03_06485 [Acetobacteraceae bacterium]|nr:hypothetical protein [Acetobacteraceae bacterium]
MFTSAEKTAIRRYCGYPAYGDGDAGFQNWRFYQVYGLMEFRLNNLSPDEETVVRGYLQQLANLELAIVRASDNLDTEQAAVWTRNKTEIDDRLSLFDSWRRRLCAFFGLPPGPALRDGGVTLVV